MLLHDCYQIAVATHDGTKEWYRNGGDGGGCLADGWEYTARWNNNQVYNIDLY